MKELTQTNLKMSQLLNNLWAEHSLFLEERLRLLQFSNSQERLEALIKYNSEILKNKVPFYEIISGAAIAFAALLLIIPGFATDILGFSLIFPFTRKLILGKFSKKLHVCLKSLIRVQSFAWRDCPDVPRSL